MNESSGKGCSQLRACAEAHEAMTTLWQSASYMWAIDILDRKPTAQIGVHSESVVISSRSVRLEKIASVCFPRRKKASAKVKNAARLLKSISPRTQVTNAKLLQTLSQKNHLAPISCENSWHFYFCRNKCEFPHFLKGRIGRL